MFVVKRDGRKEPVHFDKITARITKLSYGLNSDFCDPVGVSDCSDASAGHRHSLTQKHSAWLTLVRQRRVSASLSVTMLLSCLVTRLLQVMVAQKVAVGVYKGVTTSELDELAAETSASMTATHPDYALVQS